MYVLKAMASKKRKHHTSASLGSAAKSVSSRSLTASIDCSTIAYYKN